MEVELDEMGACRTKVRNMVFANPRPSTIDFHVSLRRAEDRLIGSLDLAEVMLFSARGGRQIPSGTVNRSMSVATSGFVLLLSSNVTVGALSLENLIVETTEEISYGGFHVIPLRWADTRRPCSVTVARSDQVSTWEFDKCLEFELELQRCGWNGPQGVHVPEFVGTLQDNFEVRITPSPTDAEVALMLLEAVRTIDGTSASLPLAECGPERRSDDETIVPSAQFGDLIAELAGQDGQAAEISVFLKSDSARSAAKRLLLLPSLHVGYEQLKVGGRPIARLSIGVPGRSQVCELHGEDGVDVLEELSVFIENDGDSVSVETKAFTGEVHIPHLEFQVGISAELCPAGCFLWNEAEGSYSELEDLNFLDISDWKLMTVDPVPGGSLVASPPLELDSQDCIEGICRRHRIVENEALRAKTVEVELEVAKIPFSFFINNDAGVDQMSFRSHARGGKLVGKHLLSGGSAYSVIYLIYDEYQNEIHRTNPFACDPHSTEETEVIISLPEHALSKRKIDKVTVRAFLRRPYGVEPITGKVFIVSLEDRLVEEDEVWARQWMEAGDSSGCDVDWRYLLDMIRRSGLSGDTWEDLGYEVARRFMRARMKRLTGRCREILNKEFAIDV